MAIPTAKLKLKALVFGDDWTCDYFRQRFTHYGVEDDRLILEEPTMQIEKFFSSYHTIDIALDPIPYNGGTTTCEALWMGVPVIALEGRHFCSRMGHSLLHTVGLPELSASNEAEYVEIARTLTFDIPRLQTIRQSLRSEMISSSLCDGSLATKELEFAYRQMWHKYSKG